MSSPGKLIDDVCLSRTSVRAAVAAVTADIVVQSAAKLSPAAVSVAGLGLVEDAKADLGVRLTDCGRKAGQSCFSPAIEVMCRGDSLASIKHRLSLVGLREFERRAIGRDGNGFWLGKGLSFGLLVGFLSG